MGHGDVPLGMAAAVSGGMGPPGILRRRFHAQGFESSPAATNLMSKVISQPSGHVLLFAIGGGMARSVNDNGELYAEALDTWTAAWAQRDHQREGQPLPGWLKRVYVSEEEVDGNHRASSPRAEVPEAG